MSLTVRKIVVLGLIGIVFLMANILIVANWIAETGIAEKAGCLWKEFLTGTAIAVIVALIILLVRFMRKPVAAEGFSCVDRRCGFAG